MEELKSYSRSDFLDGTEPYEWLYNQCAGDDFKLQRMMIRMCEIAEKAGVKNFKTLYKEYTKRLKMQRANTVHIDAATNFKDQPLELDCGNWVADDYGIYTETAYGERYACPHPLMPIQRLINIDTGIEKLQLAFRKGTGNWQKVIADKKTLASNQSIIGLADYGISVTSESARFLVQYISDLENINYDAIPIKSSVSRMGWIGEKSFSPYVDDLIFDGDANFKSFFDSVKRVGNYEKWIQFASESRKYNTITRITLACSFASVLVDPCDALCFFLHLWGGSEAGKTVGIMLATSVWADPERGKYWRTFNSTSVGQELSASFVNSMPLIIDELQIDGDRKSFDKMIYSLAEGVGRTRGSKTGGLQKISTWSNCIMTTGEMPITNASSMSGAVNRILEIDCKEQKLFKDPLAAIAFMKQNYGFAGKEFVELLQNDENMELAKSKQKELYKELVKGESTEKQAMAASLILTADYLTEKWIFKDGCTLSTADIEPFLTTKAEVSANDRAYAFLIDFLAINRNRFQKNSFGEYEGDVWGSIEPSECINDTGDFAYIIKSQFDKIMRNEGYNPTAFLSWAKQKKVIRYKRNRNTLMKRIAGNVCNCVCLRLDTDIPEDEKPPTIDFSDISET